LSRTGSAQMIEFTVLGGYLGTGKTTLLNHILKHNQGRRFALLINDFGDINIDTELVESRSDSQINLANGCVCCTLSDGFFEAIETLQQLEPPPEHIIVEASGVADVQNLAQYGYGNNFQLAGIVVVADAETVREKANDKFVAQTVRRQLQAADLIVLNKADLCPTEHLDAVTAWLHEVAPATPVVKTSFGQVPLSVLLSIDPNRHQHEAHDHPQHEQYTSWSRRSEQRVSRERLEQFLQQLPASVIRAKGLFADQNAGTLEAQVVGARRDIYAHASQDREVSEVVAIGLAGQLDTALLDHLAAELFADS